MMKTNFPKSLTAKSKMKPAKMKVKKTKVKKMKSIGKMSAKKLPYC